MSRRGENIYKRKDGRYEGRYVTGRTLDGKTRFGYVYAHSYSEVRLELMRKKVEQANIPAAPSLFGHGLYRLYFVSEKGRGTKLNISA